MDTLLIRNHCCYISTISNIFALEKLIPHCTTLMRYDIEGTSNIPCVMGSRCSSWMFPKREVVQYCDVWCGETFPSIEICSHCLETTTLTDLFIAIKSVKTSRQRQYYTFRTMDIPAAIQPYLQKKKYRHICICQVWRKLIGYLRQRQEDRVRQIKPKRRG